MNAATVEQPATREGRADGEAPWRRVATFLLVGVALALALRAQTFSIPLGFDPDEGVSLLQGRAIVNGTLPYVAYFDNRQPLLYANFAVAQLLFGEHLFASRLWATINVGVAAAFVGLIAHRLVAGRAAAFVAMALLCATSMTSVPAALSEAFLLPWTSLAVLLALVGGEAETRRGRLLWVAASGLALGVGAEVKLLGLAEGVAVVFAFCLGRSRHNGGGLPSAGESVGLLATLGIAVALPTLALAAIYAAAGHFATFVYASFTYNRIYGATATFDPRALLKFVVTFAVFSLALAPPVAAALVLRPRGSAVWLGAVWACAAFLGACATKRFYGHYSLTIVPPLCLMAAAGVEAIVAMPPRRRRLMVATMLVCCAPLVGSFLERRRTIAALELVNGPVADAIAARTQPGDVVFLGNHDPAHYYTSRTEPATYWIFPLWIGDEQWLRVSGLDARAELRRIVDSRPRVISYTYRLNYGWDAATVDYFDALMKASPDYEPIDLTGQPFQVFVLRGK